MTSLHHLIKLLILIHDWTLILISLQHVTFTTTFFIHLFMWHSLTHVTLHHVIHYIMWHTTSRDSLHHVSQYITWITSSCDSLHHVTHYILWFITACDSLHYVTFSISHGILYIMWHSLHHVTAYIMWLVSIGGWRVLSNATTESDVRGKADERTHAELDVWTAGEHGGFIWGVRTRHDDG